MDEQIKLLEKKLEEKRKELIDIKGFTYKTKRVLKLDDKSYNFNVLSVEQLNLLYGKLNSWNKNKLDGFELIIDNEKCDNWLNDIIGKINEKNSKVKKSIIETLESQLESMYSEEAKKEKNLNDILNKINNI